MDKRTGARQISSGAGEGFAHASSDASSDASEGDSNTAIITKPKSQTKTPRLYRVMLINDDFTPMEFVILVLQKFFNKNLEEATQIMLQVHHQGAGLCGVFSHEIAETKVYQVNQFAKQNRHPLKSAMESV